MSLTNWFQKMVSPGKKPEPVSLPTVDREAQPDDDSMATLQELSRFVNSGQISDARSLEEECTDYALILGNLFRSQGDIDRAVRLRETLLATPGLNAERRASIFFELGRDYRKAGFYDRASAAFREARTLGYAPDYVSQELALLAASSGDYERAAAESAHYGNFRAEACYNVQLAEEYSSIGNDGAAMRLIKKALNVFPGSPEAWLRLVTINLVNSESERSFKRLKAGLERADKTGKLILLEGLHAFIKGPVAPHIDKAALGKLAVELSAYIDKRDPDVVLSYYAGLFLQAADKEKLAEQWFTKCLVLDPDFWAARLSILSLSVRREKLPLLLSQQIDFFSSQAAHAKRFRCDNCGLRRDTIFSVCPRCRAWHSAAFRSRFF